MSPYRIQQPFDELQSLIQDLGIYDAPAPFFLSEIVAPVSLVDTQVTINAQTAPVIPTLRSSAGELTNPAANTRLADTGQLAAGDYYVQFFITINAGYTGLIRLRRRNAADAADVSTLLLRGEAETVITIIETLADNERLVLENSAAPGAGIIFEGVIWTRRL